MIFVTLFIDPGREIYFLTRHLGLKVRFCVCMVDSVKADFVATKKFVADNTLVRRPGASPPLFAPLPSPSKCSDLFLSCRNAFWRRLLISQA